MTALAKRSVIKFYCSTCEQKLSVPAGLEGQKFSCPNCAAPGHVPGSAPRESGLNGEAIIKFFCLHCGQKLSCESGAEGKSARCPVCGDSTPVPGASKSKTPENRPTERARPPLNGRRTEEPEVVLGPDPEKTMLNGEAVPAASPAANTRQDPAPDKSTPDEVPAEDPDDLNGAVLESQKTKYVMGSVSPEELFESLEDLGFEVEHLTVTPKENAPDAESE